MPEPEVEDQGDPIDPEGQDNGEGSQSEGDNGEGEGGEETPPETFKVGEKEYTADQIKEMEKDSKAYKGLLPDYTIKSQRLAELEKGPKKDKPPPEEPFYLKKGWVPKDYGELQEALRDARESGNKAAIKAVEQAETKKATAAKQIDDFVVEVKEGDKEFDEDDFFEYAQKHKFPINSLDSLRSIYSSYKEVRDAGGEGAKKAKENLLKRKEDTISGPKGGGKGGFHVPMKELRQSGSAVEAVQRALEKSK